MVEECLRQPATLVVCIREKQMTLAQSSKRLIEDKLEAFNVGNLFRVYVEKIVPERLAELGYKPRYCGSDTRIEGGAFISIDRFSFKIPVPR